MEPDPIVEEIREIRERLAAKFNYDVVAIAKDAQVRDALGDRLVVRRASRPPVNPADPGAWWGRWPARSKTPRV